MYRCSMRATDIKPNRIIAAQEAAKAFLQELPRNVKVGIVTFAGTATVVQPATLQREDLVAAIDKFQLQRGTAVGSGIVVALSELFPDHGIDVGEMTYGNGRRGKSIDEAPRQAEEGVRAGGAGLLRVGRHRAADRRTPHHRRRPAGGGQDGG